MISQKNSNLKVFFLCLIIVFLVWVLNNNQGQITRTMYPDPQYDILDPTTTTTTVAPSASSSPPIQQPTCLTKNGEFPTDIDIDDLAIAKIHPLSKEVYGTLDFYVGLVHKDWVNGAEQHVIFHLYRTVKSIKGRGCIMVDVGMNDGWFTQMAAMLECQVYAFEIQKRCIDYSRMSAKKNNLQHKVAIFQYPVSSENNKEMTLKYDPDAPCSGVFGWSRADCPQCPEKVTNKTHTFTSVSLDSFFHDCPNEVIDFLKVDVEGHETQVLIGAEDLFRTHRIRQMSVEIIPERWDKPRSQEYFMFFTRILTYGYKLTCGNARVGVLDFTNGSEWLQLNAINSGYGPCIDFTFFLESVF